MRNTFRLALAAMAFAALAACSRTSEPPALSDDLKADLARAGAADVQLAGAAGPRVEVVSAAERIDGAVATPKAPSRAPTNARTSPPKSRATPPAEKPAPEPAPEPAPIQARPQAPQPSTQKEPPGGWKTPGQVIRNAPFPINP